ncbi:MAG: NUDIX hydrolase [Cyanobacteria bacterium P01_A01_bin.135]
MDEQLTASEIVAPIEVAIALLLQGERFLLQLRDDVPGILYPGHWGFFGGHLDPGETPEEAVLRELREEIDYAPPYVQPYLCHWGNGQQFTTARDRRVTRHVFVAPLKVPIGALDLGEGWDLGLLTADDIEAGACYSPIAERSCPIGAPHQEILRAFMAVQSGYLLP